MAGKRISLPAGQTRYRCEMLEPPPPIPPADYSQVQILPKFFDYKRLRVFNRDGNTDAGYALIPADWGLDMVWEEMMSGYCGMMALRGQL